VTAGQAVAPTAPARTAPAAPMTTSQS
jgi:hypothetical protein